MRNLDRAPVALLLLPHAKNKDRMRQHHAELERLIAAGKAFVVVTNASDGEESPEEKKAQALWFKKNLGPLMAVCRAFVVFEPSPDKRSILKQKAMKGAEAFPISIEIEPTLEDAIERAFLIMSVEHADDLRIPSE
ncbi:hypothetical protein [Methylorubrum zatmanii]